MAETEDNWDFGRRDKGDERRKSFQKQMERCSFDGAPSTHNDDGYAGTSNNYFKTFSEAHKGKHPERNSAGDLVALAAEPRDSTMKRPPSIDMQKPFRSEGLPDGASSEGAPARMTAGSGPAVPGTQGPDDTEYKQTGYFARMSAAKAGFPERGEHTSSSLLDLASHDAPQADGAQAAPQ